MGSPGEVPVTVSQCPSAPISYKAGELNYGFDIAANSNPSGFYFGQRWASKAKAAPADKFIQTAGYVVIQAASAGAVDPVTVDLDVKLSHDELADVINIKQDTAGLVFESDTFLKGFTGAQPCISIVATISVASSANVSSFDIDTVVLPIELKKSLQLISGNLFIHSTAGSISSESTDLESRRIEVETTSNTISGSFPLYDLLSLKSVSGTVNVDVDPRESGPIERSGVLVIRTFSGSIQASTATSSIPARNFTTQIHTTSGTVSGSYLLGVASNVNSASGTINADFYTAGEVANRSLILSSVSGAIHSTVHDQSYELGTVRSNVHSQSGSVNIQFPAAWEGQIQAETKTGSIGIVGDGVKIIKDISPIPGYGKVVIAEKGDGYSNLSAQTLNGAINLRIA
jgi:DUF4097 and DUF4098 domain-containing protein YvlB